MRLTSSKRLLEGFSPIAILLVVMGVFTLVFIGYSLYFHLHSGITPGYYLAEQKIAAKCGSQNQLLGVAIKGSIITYAFTSGTCGSTSSTQVVDVDFDVDKNILDDLRIRPLGVSNAGFSEYDPTRPVVLSNWKVTSQQAFQIIGGQPNPGVRYILQLYQDGSMLVWRFTQGGSQFTEVLINATDGSVISRRSFVLTI
jgi:hypothetical protein